MTETRNILLIGRTGNGKSTLANVLTGVDEFKESKHIVSETQEIQEKEFENYNIIDTVGFGDTRMSIWKALSKLATTIYSVRDGLSQILLVTEEKLAEETKSTYYLLKEIVFDEKIAEYTTIVRTKFENFETPKECKNECLKIINSSGDFKCMVENCFKGGRIIHVDNPPVDTRNERKNKINKETRKKSREKLLDYLENRKMTYENYRPNGLVSLSNAISPLIKKKEELMKNDKKEEIKEVDREIVKKMIEHIKKVHPRLGDKLRELWDKQKEEAEKGIPFNWIWDELSSDEEKDTGWGIFKFFMGNSNIGFGAKKNISSQNILKEDKKLINMLKNHEIDKEYFLEVMKSDTKSYLNNNDSTINYEKVKEFIITSLEERIKNLEKGIEELKKRPTEDDLKKAVKAEADKYKNFIDPKNLEAEARKKGMVSREEYEKLIEEKNNCKVENKENEKQELESNQNTQVEIPK